MREGMGIEGTGKGGLCAGRRDGSWSARKETALAERRLAFLEERLRALCSGVCGGCSAGGRCGAGELTAKLYRGICRELEDMRRGGRIWGGLGIADQEALCGLLDNVRAALARALEEGGGWQKACKEAGFKFSWAGAAHAALGALADKFGGSRAAALSAARLQIGWLEDLVQDLERDAFQAEMDWKEGGIDRLCPRNCGVCPAKRHCASELWALKPGAWQRLCLARARGFKAPLEKRTEEAAGLMHVIWEALCKERARGRRAQERIGELCEKASEACSGFCAACGAKEACALIPEADGRGPAAFERAARREACRDGFSHLCPDGLMDEESQARQAAYLNRLIYLAGAGPASGGAA